MGSTLGHFSSLSTLHSEDKRLPRGDWVFLYIVFSLTKWPMIGLVFTWAKCDLDKVGRKNSAQSKTITMSLEHFETRKNVPMQVARWLTRLRLVLSEVSLMMRMIHSPLFPLFVSSRVCHSLLQVHSSTSNLTISFDSVVDLFDSINSTCASDDRWKMTNGWQDSSDKTRNRTRTE